MIDFDVAVLQHDPGSCHGGLPPDETRRVALAICRTIAEGLEEGNEASVVS